MSDPVFGPRGLEASPPFEPEDEPTVADEDDMAARMRLALGAQEPSKVGFVTGYESDPAFEIDDEETPRSEQAPPFYLGSNDAVARVEALPDGTIVASGSSLNDLAVVIEPRDEDDVSPNEDALVPLFRNLVLGLGAAALLRVIGKADRQNEQAGDRRGLRLVRREG